MFRPGKQTQIHEREPQAEEPTPLRTLWRQEETFQPWDDDLDEDVNRPGAKGICPRCMAEHDRNQWFCRECGAAVGDYNNVMPELLLFSIGEVARTGSNGLFAPTRRAIAGYVLFGCISYTLLAPWYLVMLISSLRRNVRS
jgi:hypothetical protein